MLDVLITGGELYDGEGGPPVRGDLAIAGGRIAAVSPVESGSGPAVSEEAGTVIDATGKAVAPGFINILSHSYLTILNDPRSLGELTQGVTTEVFGEGSSMGPLTPALRTELQRQADDLAVEVTWTRLSEYLSQAEQRGVAQNVASYIGAGTLRANAVGYEDRPATRAELDRMAGLVAEEMADGALGIASALIYPPGSFAPTEELVAVCAAAARYDGRYASHLRSEGAGLVAGVEELVRICREAGVPGEIFHLKASGRQYWGLMEPAIAAIEEARSSGDRVTADVYPYTASSTGLTTIIPARYHEGGPQVLYDRLADPATRAEIGKAVAADRRWGDVDAAEDILILGVRHEDLRSYQGQTLAGIARRDGTDPIEAALELIARDRSRVTSAFFSMSEDNLVSALRRPWVSIVSDGASMAPEGRFLRSPTHPRAYGSFARVLGRYVRDQGVLGLSEGVRRMTALPAGVLGLAERGRLRPGYAADVVVFDPDTVADRATFEEPHQFSKGVTEVLVNGRVAIRAGRFTGELAGRALRGAGAR